MATNNARQAVLQTAELLEQILIGLDFFDVWRCQRVCKQFQGVIQQSGKLQEMMMLRLANGPREIWERYFKPSSEDTRWKASFRILRGSEAQSLLPTYGAKPTRLIPAKLCPVLQLSHLGWSELPDCATRLQHRSGESVMFDTWPGLDSPASWKELFVTDPPCTKASVTLELSIGSLDLFQGGRIGVVRTVEAAEGLKVGHLVERPFLEMAGEVSWSLKGQSGWKHYKYPARLLKRFEDRLKAKAAVSRARTVVHLEGIVIPTEVEWQAVSTQAEG